MAICGNPHSVIRINLNDVIDYRIRENVNTLNTYSAPVGAMSDEELWNLIQGNPH
jgi:hypothetical protein